MVSRSSSSARSRPDLPTEQKVHAQYELGMDYLKAGGLLPIIQKAPYVAASLSLDMQGMKLSIAMPKDPSWVPAERKFYFGAPGDGAAKPLRVSTGPGTVFEIGSRVWLEIDPAAMVRVE